MEAPIIESSFSNPYIAILIGAAVSLDVIALTFCSPNIYSSSKKTWWRWAKYNAGWHAGLLLTYLVLIDVFSVFAQYLALFLSLELPEWLQSLAPIWHWFGEKFRSHIVVYVAVFAMSFVWFQYSSKIVSIPNDPDIKDTPFFIRKLFRRKQGELNDKNSRWFWHLSACLVAVDMLALAAVVKSGEKLIQFPNGINIFETTIYELNSKIASSFNLKFLIATTTVTVAVFIVVGLLCFASAYMSKIFWNRVSNQAQIDESIMSANLIVIALRLLEPLVIFYFIIHSMAFLTTGVPLHSPAFLLGSGFLVAALIQYVGLQKIIAASNSQVLKTIKSSGR